jgi:phosphopantothenoylcysteine decarboxylase/phosphopantothenate--cysteine ligase
MFPIHKFNGRHILVGVSGGIAAYKAAELVRYLVTQNTEVKVIMTRAAEKFITALTLETLSQNPVEVEMFPEGRFSGTHHIRLADWAEAGIIVPASYNVIGKLHTGIADDLLTTIWAAVHCPTVIAPAMNVHMWNNPVLQRNIDELATSGYLICPPDEGFLAEGYSGKGRLAPLEHLVQYLYRALHPDLNSLSGKRVLITAGRTEEPIDPVRIISNRSSGKMGMALAWEAWARGAQVTLIHGPLDVPVPVNVEMIPAFTAGEMFEAVKQHFPENDLYISSAAVADYTPSEPLTVKMKKQNRDLKISFKPTPDILKYCGENRRQDQVLIGFALETDKPEATGLKKLHNKKLDMIVINNPEDPGAAFDSETNIVTLIHKNGTEEKVSMRPKVDVAFQIFEFLLNNL